MSNYDHIALIDERIENIREMKRIRKYLTIIYSTMLVGLFTVFMCLWAINFELTDFETECMNTLDVTRREIDDLKAVSNATDEFIVEETNDAEIVNLDLAERELIERVVSAEARGETYEGIVAVAQVIKDRGDLWNMSYEDVVLAPSQFATPYSGEVPEIVKTAVSDVFDNGVRAFEEPVTHFHNGSVNPSWAGAKVYRGQIGSHYFYG